MRKTTRILTMALALFVGLQLFAGCSNDDAVQLPTGPKEPEGAPQLPSMSTMKLELNFFGIETPVLDEATLSKGTPSDQLMATTAGDHSNWINAFVRAIFVQLIMYDALQEPIGAFALAIHSVPQAIGDGSYLWTYIFVEDGVEYSIFLYGTPMTDRVVWRLEVSADTPELVLDHFVWFEGVGMRNESEGYWQFYEPVATPPGTPTDGTELMRIDWENISASEHRVTVTVNGAGLEDEGDYLEFYETGTMGSITAYDASILETSQIVWYADGSGSLTVPDYNDGLQACWDTEQVNIDCP